MPKLHHALFTLALAGVASTLAAPGTAQQARPQGPCDIYAAAGTPCVTAHSTVRSLSSRYGGPLYQVKRADGRLLDIGVIAGGFADAAAQDRFCAGALCYINRIYDQSGKGNDLMQAPPGPLYPGPDKGAFDTQPIADMAPITIGGGHKAYGVYIMPGMGFRNNNARDLPIDDEPAGIHAVVDGEHYSNGCCFNYGNASTNGLAVGTGTMESVYFGTSTVWGSGSGTGPWIMSDMEAGLFSGYNARVNEANPTITWRFVTGVFGGGGRNFWELKGGNAQQGGLQTFYAGVRPGSKENSAYYPMHKKGAIQMGNGGDNGNGSAGTFYEGVMTAGHPGDGVADKVQAEYRGGEIRCRAPDADAAHQLHAECGQGSHREFRQHERGGDGECAPHRLAAGRLDGAGFRPRHFCLGGAGRIRARHFPGHRPGPRQHGLPDAARGLEWRRRCEPAAGAERRAGQAQ